MPNQMSDAEVLAQTAEWLSRLADTIDRATAGLADSIAQVRAEQGELRDEVLTLARRLDALERDHNEKYVEVRSDIVALLNP